MTDPLPPLPTDKEALLHDIDGAIRYVAGAQHEARYEENAELDKALRKAMKHLKRALGEASAIK